MIAFLNELLLEAERAGARVAIQHDEARWCAMLQDHVKTLGAEPSAAVGAFCSKAMGIADLGERIGSSAARSIQP